MIFSESVNCLGSHYKIIIHSLTNISHQFCPLRQISLGLLYNDKVLFNLKPVTKLKNLQTDLRLKTKIL